MFVFKQFKTAAGPHQGRILVSRAGRGQYARGKLQDAQPDGHKHLRLIMLTDAFIDKRQDFPRGSAHHRPVTDQDVCNHHEQGRGNPFPRYVPDHHGQVIIVNKEEIIEIAADLPGRCHGSEDIQVFPVRKSREYIRNRIGLDGPGQIQFRNNPFLFRRESRQVVNIVHHVLFHGVNRACQAGNFGIPADRAQRFRQGVFFCETGSFV